MQQNSTIGIIGGGQLGRMICFWAHKMGYRTVILTDQQDSPASFVTNKTIIAKYDDEFALRKFASLIDVATFEFENIPFKTVEFLSSLKPVFPNANVLKTTQDRILEKTFLNSIGVPTADFVEVKAFDDLKSGLHNFQKAILKTATMGYDGKGQFVLENVQQAQDAWKEVAGQKLVLEKFCPFDSELSVMVARSKSGEVLAYDPLTNIHKNAILDESIYPAKVCDQVKEKAKAAAQKIADKIELVGILAVEFFAMPDDTLLVNELAPRPHNSGHFSMDGAYTSQFEQVVRAVSGLELGRVDFYAQGYMKNLIGDEVNHLEEYKKNPNAKIHLYGKKEAKPGRKMGHVNILS